MGKNQPYEISRTGNKALLPKQSYKNLKTNEVKELAYAIGKNDYTEYWFTDGSCVDSTVIWEDWEKVEN